MYKYVKYFSNYTWRRIRRVIIITSGSRKTTILRSKTSNLKRPNSWKKMRVEYVHYVFLDAAILLSTLIFHLVTSDNGFLKECQDYIFCSLFLDVRVCYVYLLIVHVFLGNIELLLWLGDDHLSNLLLYTHTSCTF